MPSEPIGIVQASFSRGEVNPRLFGRVDLAAYGTSLRTLRNFYVGAEGCVSNRPGFAQKSLAVTNGKSVLIPFVFSTTQSYMCEFADTGIQVYAFGVPVGSLIASPYASADLPSLRYTQSADTLTVFHPNYPPYELKRTGATTFTFTIVTFKNGPFLPQNSDGVTFVYASAITGNVTLTATGDIFKPTHVGALFQLTQQDFSTIPPWEGNKGFDSAQAIGRVCRSNGKNYKCVSVPKPAATSFATGSFQPIHSQGTQLDGTGDAVASFADCVGVSWQYQDSGFGIVKITGYTDSKHVTGTVLTQLPTSVIGGASAAFGPWTFSGDGSTTDFSPLTSATSTDPTKFYVTVGGVYQDPSTYTINKVVTVYHIVFNSAPVTGSSNIVVQQITALGQTSYWAFGAFSPDQGYPSTGTYFPDRLVMAGTPQQPVGVFGSKTSNYKDFGVSSPLVASDAFSVFLNARQLNAITDLIPLSDLVVGTSNILWRLWPGSTGTALSPLAIAATPQSFYGAYPKCAATLYGESAVYVDYNGRRIRDLIYQIQFDKFVGQELTLLSRHLIPYGTAIIKMAYQSDPVGQLYALRSDGVLLACTYMREQEIIGWSRYDTNGVIEDIAVIPENGRSVLYALIRRTINGQSARFLESMANREFASISDAFFVDCGQTYDGRGPSSVNMTIVAPSGGKAGDTALLLASSAAGWTGFKSTDPTYKNEVWLYDSSGNRVRCLIINYSTSTVVNVRFRDPVPTQLLSQPSSSWAFARTHFTVSNLPITPLSVLADGNVVQNIVTDTNSSFVLDSAAAVVQAGLGYDCDFETLPLNKAGQESIRNRAKTIPIAYIDVTETRGFKAGSSFDALYPNQERAFENYTQPTDLQEGMTSTRMLSEFGAECHLCVRQDMPLPITIRMTLPDVEIGGKIG